MRRLEERPLPEVREVIRVALELYEEDQARLAEEVRRRELLAATAEVGLPSEYLDRALARIHVRRSRGRSAALITAALACSLLAGCIGYGFASRAPLAPPAMAAPPPPPPPAQPPALAPVVYGHAFPEGDRFLLRYSYMPVYEEGGVRRYARIVRSDGSVRIEAVSGN